MGSTPIAHARAIVLVKANKEALSERLCLDDEVP